MTEGEVDLSVAALQAIKQAQKDAVREWLDDLWITVGKWTVMGLITFAFGALFAGILYLLIITHGFGTISPPSPSIPENRTG